MRIVIASTIVPFVYGGGTFIVDWLEDELQRRGHDIETLRIPFHAYYPEMLEQMLALRLLDVSTTGDRLITIRTPSHLLKHPNKVAWFIHHHRGAYDLWGTTYQDIPDSPRGYGYRDAIISADNVALRETRSLFTNSAEVSGRLKQFNDLDSEVLYPPLIRPERYHSGSYGDYIFYPSRLVHHKRQYLALEAMQHTRSNVRLIIAGVPETEAYMQALQTTIDAHGLSNRVTLISRWISESEKIELFAGSLAAMYIPLLEDSYGYPSLEAAASKRAVITTDDAGGTSELIISGRNGLVTESTPEALAQAMDSLFDDRAFAKQMGDAAQGRVDELGITWDHLVERLLA